jgi:hypothetical protein
MVREISATGRSVTRIDGNLASVRCRPVGSSPSLEAELSVGDGPAGSPGVIRLVWMGQQQISGIEPGRPLTVEGMLGTHRGRKTMFNPRYQLGRD